MFSVPERNVQLATYNNNLESRSRTCSQSRLAAKIRKNHKHLVSAKITKITFPADFDRNLLGISEPENQHNRTDQQCTAINCLQSWHR
jgi:hypothetical protein